MSGLYKAQKEALNKLETGSVLCGGVGTGKSRTALAYFTLKVCNGYSTYDNTKAILRKPRPLYIITTARKRDTLEWEDEALPFHILVDSDRSVAPITIDSWNNIDKYTGVEKAFFIFDEQRIVGKGSWSKSFLKIAKKNDWIILTATPGDTWMDYATLFIANGFYKNRTDFYQQHVVFNRFTKYPKVDRYVNTNKLERLRSEILVPMEFSKEAVRHEKWIKVGYDADFYNRFAIDRWNVYENHPIENASQYCQLCRKVVNEDKRRCEAVWNILEKKHRAIIFYNFDYELELLIELMEKHQYPHSQWNGHKHELIPNERNWAYLVQYTAGAEGWNCIETDSIIFYSLNYSYKMTEQAQGRIDRLNTPYKDLWYYFIFSESPIDHEIRNCLKRKTVFNERVFTQNQALKTK